MTLGGLTPRGAIRGALVVVIIVGITFSGGVGTYAYFSDSKATAPAQITIAAQNGPVADAGGPYTVSQGSSISLNGNNSRGNGQLTYDWQITSGGGQLFSTDSAQPVYFASGTSGSTVTVELTVSNNKGSDTDTADITVDSSGSGCGNTELTLCSVLVYDSEWAGYWVYHEADDPQGGAQFQEVRVTLFKNGNQIDRDTSTSESGLSNVIPDGGGKHTIRVELIDTTGNVSECREAVNDKPDGSNPPTSPC